MTEPQVEPTRVGEVLAGRYTLIQRLGGGGVGEVYRARDERLKREVAIKLLRREHNRSRDVVQRLLREAQVTDQVRHPNVLEVFDVDVDPSGVPFIVQELLRGEDLSEHIARCGGRLTVDAALAYMIPVCDAVATAHLAGVVHRDLKPENVFLMQTAAGVIPKVLDFGLARVLLAPGSARLTATGLTMGTPYFMSPEQVQGDRNLDARSDVWAIGVMLYEMLTGRLPFEGDSEGAVYVKVCTIDPTPAQMLAPWIPADLATVIARCLRKDLPRRYPNASGVMRDLTHIQRREAVEPTLTGSPLSTQQMRVVPVSLESPAPSSAPMSAPPSAPAWNPPRPPLPATVTRPAPRRGGAHTWIIIAAVALILLSLGVGLGVLYLLSNDEAERRRVGPAPFTPTVAAPRLATPGAGALPNAPTAAPTAPTPPTTPVRPAAPMARAPAGETGGAIAPKPRGVRAPAAPAETPSEPGTVSSGPIVNPARQPNHGGFPIPFGSEPSL